MPEGRAWSGPLQGPLFGLAPDGVFRASRLAPGAVGSYPTFSPLPGSLAVLSPDGKSMTKEPGGIFSVALSVKMPRGILPRVYPRQNRGYAASRPLVLGLSSSRQNREAIFRPSRIKVFYRTGGHSATARSMPDA